MATKTYSDLSAWQRQLIQIGHDPADWQREYLAAIRCPGCEGTGDGTGGVSGRDCATCDGRGINPETVVEYLRNQASAGRDYAYDRSERTCGQCGGKGLFIDADGNEQRRGEMFCTGCGVTAAVAPDVLFALANLVRTAQAAVAVAEAGGLLEDKTMRALAQMKGALVSVQQASVRHGTHAALEGRI